jgi:hypothetical protein
VPGAGPRRPRATHRQQFVPTSPASFSIERVIRGCAPDKLSTHASPPGVFDYATYFKSKENLVPESRTRKSATEKRKLKAQQAAKPKKIKPPASRRWVPPTFIAVGLLGVAWLITFYIAGSYIPFMDALGNWNILIGMGGMAAAFALATLWR